MVPKPEHARRSLAERWEALETGVQSMIAYPIATVVIFLGHAAFFPRTRWLLAITYGFFWAMPATAAIVAATAHERRKRAERAKATAPEPDEDPGAD